MNVQKKLLAVSITMAMLSIMLVGTTYAWCNNGNNSYKGDYSNSGYYDNGYNSNNNGGYYNMPDYGYNNNDNGYNYNNGGYPMTMNQNAQNTSDQFVPDNTTHFYYWSIWQ